MTDPKAVDEFFEQFQSHKSALVDRSSNNNHETDRPSGDCGSDHSIIEDSTPVEPVEDDDGIELFGAFFACVGVLTVGPAMVPMFGIHGAWALPISLIGGAVGWMFGRTQLGEWVGISMLLGMMCALIGALGYAVGFLVAVSSTLVASFLSAAYAPTNIPVGAAAVSTTISITLLTRFEMGGPIGQLKVRASKVAIVALVYSVICECLARVLLDPMNGQQVACFSAVATAFASVAIGLPAIRGFFEVSRR